MIPRRIEYTIFSNRSRLVEDYIAGVEHLRPLLPRNFSPEEFTVGSEIRSNSNVDRNTLFSELTSQYKEAGIDTDQIPVLKDQLISLKDENTFTITTGHQLCIFMGPLYTVIKILQVIKIADQLNKAHQGKHFVPVFWMATEDHDFEEVNHAHLFNKTIQWSDQQGGMVGEYHLKSFGEALNEMDSILGESPESNELKTIFKKAYQHANNLADATRVLVHELFSNRGLIIIDGNSPAFKKKFVDVMKAEIEDQIIFETVSRTNEILNENYKIQVNPRPINLFYLDRNKRNRLDDVGDKIVEVDGTKTWKKAELIREIESNPERFSPNVLMRPLFQEIILPNLCYVGGAAEISYWLQLKPTFEKLNVPFPLLNVRNSFVWLDAAKMEKLEKLELEISDLFKPEPDIMAKLAKFDGDSIEIDKYTSDMLTAFQSMSNRIVEIDGSLESFVQSEAKRLENQFENIKGKVLRAKKKQHEVSVSAFKNLKEKVFPGNALHERYDNFVPYFLKYGHSFFDELYDNIDPYNNQLCVLTEPAK